MFSRRFLAARQRNASSTVQNCSAGVFSFPAIWTLLNHDLDMFGQIYNVFKVQKESPSRQFPIVCFCRTKRAKSKKATSGVFAMFSLRFSLLTQTCIFCSKAQPSRPASPCFLLSCRDAAKLWSFKQTVSCWESRVVRRRCHSDHSLQRCNKYKEEYLSSGIPFGRPLDKYLPPACSAYGG